MSRGLEDFQDLTARFGRCEPQVRDPVTSKIDESLNRCLQTVLRAIQVPEVRCELIETSLWNLVHPFEVFAKDIKL